MTSRSEKSSPETIRRRFDGEVDRFSNLDTGQTATMDAALCLDLVAHAAAATTPDAKAVLDVGCGAGNYTLRLLRELPGLDCTLLDLSEAMLERATTRVSAATSGRVTAVRADVRDARWPAESFDVVLAAAVFHHLRTDAEWDAVFAMLFRVLRPGGSVWIFDLIDHAGGPVRELMSRRYGDYLVGFENDAYRDRVFAYIDAEDSPRPLVDQLGGLRRAGFSSVDVLHKNGPFAAFGAVKPADPF